MKTLTTLTCAIAVAGAIAFCAPNANAVANFTTNYDVMNITATIGTNIEKSPSSDVYVYSVHTFTLDNAAILHFLEGPDWNNGSFPAGSKLVVSWDAGDNVLFGSTGDILVVGPDGRTVLYDASEAIWSNSGEASMTVDFYYEGGAYNENDNYNDPGHYDFTWFNNTSFEIYDGLDSTNLSISTTGPSTEVSKQGWKDYSLHQYTTWSDSERATTYGAGTNQVVNGYDYATVTVKISAHGHGPGVGGYYYAY